MAGAALFVSVWNWIGILQFPSDTFHDPSEIVLISQLIFLPMVGAFIALAIISFVDDEDGSQTAQPLWIALGEGATASRLVAKGGALPEQRHRHARRNAR